MTEFSISQYQDKTKIYIDADQQFIADKIKSYGNKCLILTGKNSAKVSGALEFFLNILTTSKISYEIFDGIESNPSIDSVNKCICQNNDKQIQFILAIGGGSVLDASKAIAFGLQGAQLFEKTAVQPLKIIGVCTASGTGSEVTPYCRLTDLKLRTKHGIPNKTWLDMCFFNPKWQQSVPDDQLKSMYLDVLTHACESSVSNKRNAKQLEIALKALNLLKQARNHSFKSASYFDCLIKAAIYAGISIDISPCTLPHEMSYAVTVRYGLYHGYAVAQFEYAYLKFKQVQIPDIVDQLFQAFAEDENQFKLEIDNLGQRVKVEEEDMEWIADYMVNNGKLCFHDGEITKNEIIQLFKDSQ